MCSSLSSRRADVCPALPHAPRSSDDLRSFGKKDGPAASQSVEELQDKLENALTACRAHQSHSQLLNAEIARVQAEKEQAVKIKSATIKRLQERVEELQQRCEELHANAIQRKGSSPPKMEHMRYRSVSKIVGEAAKEKEEQGRTGGEEGVEELRSMLEYVKREYFSALVISFKMQKLVDGCAISVDSLDLYERAQKQEVDFMRWGAWIRAQVDLASAPSASDPSGGGGGSAVRSQRSVSSRASLSHQPHSRREGSM